MKIKNLNHVEDALRRIAELDLVISVIDNDAAEIISRAKSDAESASRDKLAERSRLIDDVRAYSDEHRSEIFGDDKKSLDLVNGTIGYRLSPDSIEVSQTTADLLCEAGFSHCVKIKKEPVKAALRGFSDEQLAGFLAKRISGKESFFVKVSAKSIPAEKATPDRAA